MFIWDFVASTVLNAIVDWFYSLMVGFLGDFFVMMENMGVELFELPWVQSIVAFFGNLGWALFAVSLVVCAFECGIEYSNGRGDIKRTAMGIIKGFMAVSLFTTVPVRLYSLCVSLQGLLTKGLVGDSNTIGALGHSIVDGFTTSEGLMESGGTAAIGSVTVGPIMLLFCLILAAYSIVKVFFANLKRGGILLIQIAVGSLYMFSVPRGYTDGFVTWMKQIIGLGLTAFLQSTILVAGMLVFSDHPLLGLGLLLSAGEVPRVAGAFGLDTNTRANLMSAVYTVQTVVNTTQRIAQAASAAA